jgi:hypothetical protein
MIFLGLLHQNQYNNILEQIACLHQLHKKRAKAKYKKVHKEKVNEQNKQHYQKKEKKKTQERTTDKEQVIQGRTNGNEKEAD